MITERKRRELLQSYVTSHITYKSLKIVIMIVDYKIKMKKRELLQSYVTRTHRTVISHIEI